MVNVAEVRKAMNEAASLIRAYDNATEKILAAWEQGDLAAAVRQLERVYKREVSDAVTS